MPPFDAQLAGSVPAERQNQYGMVLPSRLCLSVDHQTLIMNQSCALTAQAACLKACCSICGRSAAAAPGLPSLATSPAQARVSMHRLLAEAGMPAWRSLTVSWFTPSWTVVRFSPAS